MPPLPTDTPAFLAHLPLPVPITSYDIGGTQTKVLAASQPLPLRAAPRSRTRAQVLCYVPHRAPHQVSRPVHTITCISARARRPLAQRSHACMQYMSVHMLAYAPSATADGRLAPSLVYGYVHRHVHRHVCTDMCANNMYGA